MNKKTEEEIEYDILKANLRESVKTKQGSDVIWYILELCDMYGSHFTGNNTTFFNEGRRSVGVDILQLMEDADPLMYAKLLLNRQKRKEGKDE